MIKIAHEAPISIFEEVQKVTDYDYFLVHLFDENRNYLDKYYYSKGKGRESILDNSIFELGYSFDPKRFASFVERLQPTRYIIPDVLEDKDGTIRLALEWKENYMEKVGSSGIGVVQGKDFEELVECYSFMANSMDVETIAISFDYSYYLSSFPHPNKFVSYMLGRVKFLSDLEHYKIVNKFKKHHLLGASLPQEFEFYKNEKFSWITSLDTSNPVVHGLKGIEYKKNGLWKKESQKLFELIDTKVTSQQLDSILRNISMFRILTNG